MRNLLIILMRINLILGGAAILLYLIAGLMLKQAKADVHPAHKRPIRVMAIDTGVDYEHKDITNFVPHQYKKLDNMDFHGHGTHVAGLILKDVCPQVELIPCPAFMNPSIPPNKRNGALLIAQCMLEAAKLKVDVVNISAGGEEYNDIEHDAAKILNRLNIPIVAAAGNEHSNINEHPYYPASYEFKNITRVGALDLNGKVAHSSNYGKGVVFEVGVGGIRSTLPHNRYGLMDGTSQATAKYTNRLIRNLCANRRD